MITTTNLFKFTASAAILACLAARPSFAQTAATADTVLKQPVKKELQEINITAYKNALSYKNGNIKANIENTILSTIPDAIEVLTKLPTVIVSGDRESVSVVGKGSPLIYMGNQRITLNELSTIPVSDIKSIEIINNPSAKYEADGRAVILVTRKTTRQSGSRIDANETFSKKRYLENRFGLNGSFKFDKTELKANFQHNFATRFEGLRGELNSTGFNYLSGYDGNSVGPRHQYLFGAGIYRQLQGSDYISLNIDGRAQNEHAVVNSKSYFIQNGIHTNYFTQNHNNSERPFFNSNFNYQKDLSKIKSRLFIGAQYSRYQTSVNSDIRKSTNDGPLLSDEARLQDFAVDVAVARVDFKKTFANGWDWESGTNINASRSGSVFNVNYAGTPALNTNYKYAENNQALYTQATGKYHKMDIAAGLRFENTSLQGKYKDSSQPLVDKGFAYLFPKLNIAMPLDSFTTLTLNYARSIQRPNYSIVNQVTNYIAPFLEYSNSVNIDPAITDEVSANLQYRSYSLNASVYNIQKSTWRITQYDSTLKKVRMINTNLQKTIGASLSLTIPFEYKRFTSNNEITTTFNKAIDPRATNIASKPYFYLYTSNQLKLPKDFSVLLTAWVVTRQYEGTFQREPQSAVDLSVSKVFRKKLTVTLNALDIFRTLNFVETYRINDIYSSTTFLENVKEYSISLKYSFGKIKDAKFKNKEVNDSRGRLN